MVKQTKQSSKRNETQRKDNKMNQTKSLSTLLLLIAISIAMVAAAPKARKQMEESRTSEALNDFGPDEAGEGVNDPDLGLDSADSSERAQEREDADDSEGEDSPVGAASNLRWAGNVSQLDGMDSNIANAKVRISSSDMVTAAGHHHHKKHYVHGKLIMGAETGKKGSFKWHDKHPVGGKGRR